MPTSPSPTSSAPGPRTLIALGVAAVCTTAVVVALILRDERKDEAVISIVEQPAPENRVNVSETIDARGRRDVQATAGGRYRVVVDDESRDSAAGIARIGGLVTFVPDTRRGDDVVIEVTRVKQTTAEAVVVERLGRAEPAAKPAPAANAPAPRRETTRPVAKAENIHTGRVESVGRKGDGIVKLNGKVVFVPGAEVGDEVVFAVVEDDDHHAEARLISRTPGDVEPKPAKDPNFAQPGDVFEATITDVSRENPNDGVAKVNGLVVFVPDTKPGDHLRIRIVKRLPRSAVAEMIERLPHAENAP